MAFFWASGPYVFGEAWLGRLHMLYIFMVYFWNVCWGPCFMNEVVTSNSNPSFPY